MLKEAHRRAKIISASVVATIVVFIFVVEVLRGGAGMDAVAAAGLEPVRIIFYAIAISLVLVTSLVHSFVLKATKSIDIDGVAARLVSVNVITTGLAETPAIMGFVLFLVWGYYPDFYILCFVSLYLMLRHFPYYRQWENFARNRMGEKWPEGPVAGG